MHMSWAFIYRFTLPALAVFFVYFAAVYALTDHAGTESLIAWPLREPVRDPVAYMDGKALFPWLALALADILIGLYTVYYSVRILSRHLEYRRVLLVLVVFVAMSAVWAWYLSHDDGSILRVMVFKFTIEHIAPFYENFAPALIERIRLVSKLVFFIILPSGMLGAVATASLTIAPKPIFRAMPGRRDLHALDRKSMQQLWSEADESMRRYLIDDLSRRASSSRTFLYLGSAILTISVAYIVNWNLWPAQFFTSKDDLVRLSDIATGFAFLWGGAVTLLIITAYVPVFLVLRHYGDLLASAALAEANHKERTEWLNANGVELVDPGNLRELIVMLAPLLASSAGALLKTFGG